MDEREVQFLSQPSIQCPLDVDGVKDIDISENSITNAGSSNIFMIVMTLSAPKNLEARNFIRDSIRAWSGKTSRKEGKVYFWIFWRV